MRMASAVLAEAVHQHEAAPPAFVALAGPVDDEQRRTIGSGEPRFARRCRYTPHNTS